MIINNIPFLFFKKYIYIYIIYIKIMYEFIIKLIILRIDNENIII